MVVRRVKVGMSVAGLSITDHSRRQRFFSTQLVLYERKRYERLPASIIVQVVENIILILLANAY